MFCTFSHIPFLIKHPLHIVDSLIDLAVLYAEAIIHINAEQLS